MKSPIIFGIERMIHNLPVFYYKRFAAVHKDYGYIGMFVLNNGTLVKIPIRKIDRIYDV